jgi:hypothetical protein
MRRLQKGASAPKSTRSPSRAGVGLIASLWVTVTACGGARAPSDGGVGLDSGVEAAACVPFAPLVLPDGAVPDT